MNYNAFSLNGAWSLFYKDEKYESDTAPILVNPSHEPDNLMADAIPAYWEDMTEKFKEMPFFGRLKINPEYGIQAYPILGTAPDMALPNIYGNFFYCRDIILESVADNMAIYFEGVQNSITVWINDILIGKHEGYSAPFEFAIPKDALKVGVNKFIFSVSNFRLKGYQDRPITGLTSRAANECTGGITSNVELRAYNNSLRDVALFVSDDLNKVSVKTFSDEAIEWEILDGETPVRSGYATGDFIIDAEGLEHWSPESPRLYTLRISAKGGYIERKIGIRKLTVDGVKFKLNGTPYYLRGICEHCYFPETIHPNHDKEYYKNVIKRIKELGFNFIRFHTYIPESEYMEAADELGVLIHVECPNFTTVEEWRDIVKFCRSHPSVVIFCCGNEIYVNDAFIDYLEEMSKVVHAESDGLFSPLSAMVKVEYGWWDETKPLDEGVIRTPFKHHPEKLKKIGSFSDMYSSYANGKLSYFSLDGDPKVLDDWSRVYNKPRVSHEICIDGTYTDLSLKDRYKNTRVGKTEMFSSIEKHLEEKGLLHKAPVFFKNSSLWQKEIRKHCFEIARLCDNLSGFDFLGPIDTHWHTFGYDVGMMNEFYELKPGETVENVLSYNSPTVVLTDLDKKYNFRAGDTLSCGIYLSHFGKDDLKDGKLKIQILDGDNAIYEEEKGGIYAENGRVKLISSLTYTLPKVSKPTALTLCVDVEGNKNQWTLYVFPEVKEEIPSNVYLAKDSIEDIIKALKEGRDVLVLGASPFVSAATSFRIALAGRTAGNLATVINDHPLTKTIPHEGFCSWQFAEMMNNGEAVIFDDMDIPFDPIIEVVSTHKYAIRQSALFEFKAFSGRLLVCSFNLKSSHPASAWFKSELLRYMGSSDFKPKNEISEKEIYALATKKVKQAAANQNFAFNPNDKTTAVR